MSDNIPLSLISKLNVPIPRYTSYPATPAWSALPSDLFLTRLETRPIDLPMSLYIHIPFCHSMCLYCGCSVVLNRNPEKEEQYVNSLLKEITLSAKHVRNGSTINQIHFGGGTPTKLSSSQLELILQALFHHFNILPDAEISIEIDPRTVASDNGLKLRAIREMGFNRVSFGVQDTDERVQEAVKRRQSLEMTKTTYHKARQLGFSGINMDLIYGLPYQTVHSFKNTAHSIISLRPDRIALFSYAKIPHLKPHQNAIADELLPSTEEKFRIYQEARSIFIQAGYTAIGMDHFAENQDPLTTCLNTKTLQRNFQGYTRYSGEDMLGLGLTSISFIQDAYFQNIKELTPYHEALSLQKLPTTRGIILSKEDHRRRWVINRLMCAFAVSKQEFKTLFAHDFDTHFAQNISSLAPHIEDKLVENNPSNIIVTKQGEMFVRNIAACFDEYLSKQTQLTFSKAI